MLKNIHETLNYTFYDSFRFTHTGQGLSHIQLFQRALSSDVSMLETNMVAPGFLPVCQAFHIRSFKIVFINSPEPWDIAELARKCTFTFSVQCKMYARGFVRALLPPSSVECVNVAISYQEPFVFDIRAERPLSFDPMGSGLHGHLFMQGKLLRPIQ